LVGVKRSFDVAGVHGGRYSGRDEARAQGVNYVVALVADRLSPRLGVAVEQVSEDGIVVLDHLLELPDGELRVGSGRVGHVENQTGL
jgi:hypothetical protein